MLLNNFSGIGKLLLFIIILFCYLSIGSILFLYNKNFIFI